MTAQAALPNYNIRDLCRFSVEDLWSLPDGPIRLIYDDGSINTTNRRAQYTVCVLRAFYTRWPMVKTQVAHDLGARQIRKMTHAELMGPVAENIYRTCVEQNIPIDLEALWYAGYDGFNALYNEGTSHTEEYVQPLDILDFVDVVNHPTIRTAQDAIQSTDASLNRVYATISKVLQDPAELKGNRLAATVRGGLVDMNQVLQCVGPRGKTTDLDGMIFEEPILVGFTHGFSRFYDSLIDSRLAAKAQSFTGPPLQATEYFNRQLQLLAHTLARIHYGDCGSTQHISWRVRAKDLKYLDGKYYKTPEGYRRITKNDRHLVDQLVELRSVLYCQHPDSQGVCSTCYGEISYSIPRHTNIGHVAATSLGEKISQSVLSVKHVESSSSVGDVELSEFERKYLKVGVNPNHLMIADRLRDIKGIQLVIQAKEAPHITDVNIVEDVASLQLGFVSELSEVLLKIPTGNAEAPYDNAYLSVYADNRPASLSRALLRQLRTTGWEVDSERGVYVLDLGDWDADEPLFELPLRHASMLDYAESIKDMMCAAKRKGPGQTLRDYTNVEAALKDFYALVSSRLSVNLVHLEVLIKVLMVRSRAHRDYRLPLYGNRVEFGEFTASMYLRSMAPAMAYQGQKQVLDRPMLYMVKNRPPHILDALLVPTV